MLGGAKQLLWCSRHAKSPASESSLAWWSAGLLVSVPAGANSCSFSDVRKSFALIHTFKKKIPPYSHGQRNVVSLSYVRHLSFNIYKYTVLGLMQTRLTQLTPVAKWFTDIVFFSSCWRLNHLSSHFAAGASSKQWSFFCDTAAIFCFSATEKHRFTYSPPFNLYLLSLFSCPSLYSLFK